MEKKVRVFDKDNSRYGFALEEELKNDNLATITVEFYRNKTVRKEDVAKYVLAEIKVIKKSNLR